MRVLWLVAVLAVGACARRDAERAEVPAADGPNVLLVTLDTARADRVGCYGHAAAQTPNLDGLAGAGVRFDRAYAQVPLTLPSHASLLTGVYPPETGLRINGGGRLGAEVPTLATLLQARGYRTGAFIAAAVLSRSFGLDRGFDHYDDRIREDSSPDDAVAERPGDVVCDAALAWLEQESGRPFFAWVHLFDPHHPYEPPEPYRTELSDPYDGEIAFTDAQVGRLIEWLDGRGLRERTLIVVVGDHGEAFGEHEESQHGLFIYDSTMRVPLIVAWPSRVPAGRVVGGVVQLVDILPTVLELVGLKAKPEASGRSLVAAIDQPESARESVAYGESQYPRMSFGWASLASLTTDRWKYIRAPRPELYDLQADPAEADNVIAAHADVAADLSGRLQRITNAMTIRDAAAANLNAEALTDLQSLGYVGGVTDGTADDGPEGRDPKEMVAVYRGLMRARGALQRGRFANVVALLEPLTEVSPESDALFAPLGAAYLRLGRYEDARRAYEQSLRSVPDDPSRRCGLGDALRHLGRVDEAVACYERVLASWPKYGQAHSRLGLIRARQGRHADALEHFRRFVESSPSSPNAHTNLASALMGTKQPAEAARHLQIALELSPDYQPAHQMRWQVLLAVGRKAEAVAALREACTALPQDAMLGARLAWLLAVDPSLQGDAGEAVRLAEQGAQARPNDPVLLDILGAAYANAGRFDDAIRVAQQAAERAASGGQGQLAAQISGRAQLYRQGRPFRQ